mgnify:CR=1 FL=1
MVASSNFFRLFLLSIFANVYGVKNLCFLSLIFSFLSVSILFLDASIGETFAAIEAGLPMESCTIKNPNIAINSDTIP